ncbi:MAG: recombination-associated protein RdgC [Oceanospirillaceae bacterium]|nr:recombination-associated protein RdgC [Oceanospirillaceae bacterium]MCP5351548.1 recombination-associated protein RdgC [Oceanospirillaceae bacterium]
MIVKNILPYILTKPLEDAETIATKLAEQGFRPCNSQQLESLGWAVPAPQFDGLVYEAHATMAMALKRQQRLLPAAVVNEYLSEEISAFVEREGHKPARAQRQQLKEDLIQKLLPQAFVRTQMFPLLVLPREGLLLVLAAATKTGDLVTSQLRSALGSLPVVLPKTAQPVGPVMTRWLLEPTTIPQDFTLGDEVELKDPEEESIARCRKQDLLGDEVATHIQAGKQVTKLCLIWREQISFVLEADMTIKRIRLLLEDADETPHFETAGELFAHEFAVSCTWLVPFLRDLFKAFGGLESALGASQENAFRKSDGNSQ